MASAPNATNLPLFYKDLMPLNSRDHAEWQSKTTENATWMVGQHAVPLTVEEFPQAARHFPIIFAAGENPVPLALMGLNEGAITPFSRYFGGPFFQLPGSTHKFRDWKKWGHGGAVNVSQAITESCDVYFYDLAHRVGIERMHDFAVMFGLGSATGVDQTGEAHRLPERQRIGIVQPGPCKRLAAECQHPDMHPKADAEQRRQPVDDAAGRSERGRRLRARARRQARQSGKLGLIVIDYLQLMGASSAGENRATEISEISRSLKSLGKELNCPVIALSQLNRSLEQRPNKRPVMSDLRESGAIEQDADVIMFIYRDDYYNKDSKEPGVAEIIIAKQRNGPTGTSKLAFLKQLTRFESLASSDGDF